MLTDKDRSALAPLLARICTIRAELAKAEQEAPVARGRMDDSAAGLGWWDRSFGGLFSREPARARAYHDARRASADAAAAVRRRKKELARLHRRTDNRIRPMMPRLDRDHDRFAAAIRRCDQAARKCGRLQQWVATALESARVAAVNPGRNEKATRAAEQARRRYPQLVAKVRSEAPDVERALHSARGAVRTAGGEPRHLAWRTALFDELPSAAADVHPPGPPTRTQDPLQRLRNQLSQAIATVQRWRAETTAAEADAVAAVRDRLVDEWGRQPPARDGNAAG